jgi:hypothetical protein
VQIVQALKPDDKPCHFQFAKDNLSNVEVDENYLWRWIFSDEATFYVSRRVTLQMLENAGEHLEGN